MSTYSFFPLLCASLFLLLGWFIYSRNPQSPPNRVLALSCLTTTWWQGWWVLLFSTKDIATAEIIARIGYSGIVFIPPTFFHFFVRFTDSKRDRRRVYLAYALTAGFVIAIWTSNLFVAGVHHFRWGYYPKAGWMHPAFLALLVALFLRAVTLLIRSLYAAKKNSLVHTQTRYVLFAILAYSPASVDFLMNYRLAEFYPPGFIAVLLSFGMTAYAIVRYRLMDINLAITRTTVFMLVYSLVLGLPLLGALVWETNLQRAIGPRWWVGLVIVYALLATAAHYANQYFQRRAEARLRAEEMEAHRKLRQLSQDMLRFTELKPLLDQIVHRVVKVLKVTHAAVYLTNSEDSSCKRRSAWDPRERESSLPEAIAEDSAFIQDLATIRLPRVREELKLQQQAASSGWRQIVSTMEQLRASVAIPAFKPERFFGFLVLGDKRSGRIWTQDDLNMLTLLANQAALAIENVQLHEAQADRMIKEAVDQTAIQIARGVGHQFNNALNDMKLLGEILLHTLKSKPLESLAPADLLAFANRMVKTIATIVTEATRAGGIATGVLNLTKPMPLELHPVDVKPLLEDSITQVLQRQATEKVEDELVTPAILNGLPKTLHKVPGSEAQIKQVFYNILDNAVDAIREKMFQLHKGWLPAPSEGPYKGRIQVKAQESGGRLTISIEDDGIGITPENMKQMFAPYFTTKGQSKGRGMGGHGAGLVVIKKIVEVHGGKIRVASEPAQWTRFTIDLPVEKESHGA